eukprot:Awhi_evm1s5136
MKAMGLSMDMNIMSDQPTDSFGDLVIDHDDHSEDEQLENYGLNTCMFGYCLELPKRQHGRVRCVCDLVSCDCRAASCGDISFLYGQDKDSNA